MKRLLGVVLLLLAFGCAPAAYRSHPELNSRIKDMKTPAFAQPDVKLYELTAGGIQELRDEWCAVGTANVLKALDEVFGGSGITVKPVEIDKETEEEFEDVQALYRAVSISIQLHTYNPQHIFPEKVKSFDYSLGPIDGITKKYGADGLIFLYGIDEISSEGRKALQAAGVILGAFTGVVIVPRSGMTHLNAALIDPSGSVLWYSYKSSQGGHDLRDYQSCSGIVREVFADFPLLKK